MAPKQNQDNLAQEASIEYFTFAKGIPGFEDFHKFSLQEHNKYFSLLTAVDEPSIAFVTVNPFDFNQDYEFELTDSVLEEIGVTSHEQVSVRCIVTWHSDRTKITVNLLAPIILNTDKCTGKQVVLQNTEYTTRHTLWNEGQVTGKDGES